MNKDLIFHVVKRNGHYYISGLVNTFATSFGNKDSQDTLLLYHYSSEESECPKAGRPSDSKKMHGCLYDEWQCNEDMATALKKSGADRIVFITPHGQFCTNGVHVVEHKEAT